MENGTSVLAAQEAMKEDIRQVVTEHVEASNMDNLDAIDALHALGHELEEMYREGR